MHEVFFYPENFHAGLNGRKLTGQNSGSLIAAAVGRIRHALGF